LDLSLNTENEATQLIAELDFLNLKKVANLSPICFLENCHS
jgi:hypothetical protein